jgi:hypothetical protein
MDKDLTEYRAGFWFFLAYAVIMVLTVVLYVAHVLGSV